MIEKKFKGVLEGKVSDEEIVAKSKQFAKSTLETELLKLKKDHQSLTGKFMSHKEQTTTAIEALQTQKEVLLTQKETLQTQKQNESKVAKDKAEENRMLKKELRQKYITNQLFRWRLPALLLIPIGVLIVLFYLMLFIWQNASFNLSVRLVDWIDSFGDGSRKTFLMLIYLAPVTGLVLIIKLLYSRYFNKKHKKDKLKIIEEDMPNHYK
jgi:Fe2+ transport system protein B